MKNIKKYTRTQLLEAISYWSKKLNEAIAFASDEKKPLLDAKTAKTLTGLDLVELPLKPFKGDIEMSCLGDYDQRVVCVVNYNGVYVPFYFSSGNAGKDDPSIPEDERVPHNKWYNTFGIAISGDGWINKASKKDIKNFYGSLKLKQIADILNAKLGDCFIDGEKNSNFKFKIPHMWYKRCPEAFKIYNKDCQPVSNGQTGLAANINQLLQKIGDGPLFYYDESIKKFRRYDYSTVAHGELNLTSSNTQSKQSQSSTAINNGFDTLAKGIQQASIDRMNAKGRSNDFKKNGEGYKLFKQQFPDWSIEVDNGDGTVYFKKPSTQTSAPASNPIVFAKMSTTDFGVNKFGFSNGVDVGRNFMRLIVKLREVGKADEMRFLDEQQFKVYKTLHLDSDSAYYMKVINRTTNATYVNNKLLDTGYVAKLQPGTTIQIGSWDKSKTKRVCNIKII